MAFSFFLSKAFKWKYFVLRSPSLIHCTFDLCCHMISSLSSKSLISCLKVLISLPRLPPLSLRTSVLRVFLFFCICQETCAKTALFHLERSMTHCFNIVAIPFWGIWIPTIISCYFNNLSALFHFDPHSFKVELSKASVISRAQWSEVESTIWCTFTYL